MSKSQTVLITGTTSGIGRSLLAHYHCLGTHVICVNRREDSGLRSEFPQAEIYVIDITSPAAVAELARSLARDRRLPNLIYLNAGINKADNLVEGFDYQTFVEVLQVNLMGTMTFVSEFRRAGIRGATFIGFSSVSNIVPNPGHYSYYLSKLGIHEGFRFLQKHDSENFYKTIVLGPIRTAITRHYDGPKGFGRRLLEFLSRDVDQFIPEVTRFAENRKSTLYYPGSVCVFYWFMKWGLRLIPIYSGTRRGSAAVERRT